MARLITPRPKNVSFVIAIVFPIHGPIGMVMFPDESAGELCLTQGDIAGDEKGTLQVATLSRCFERGNQDFTAMHVGILAAVRGQRFPVAGRLIRVQTVFLRPNRCSMRSKVSLRYSFPSTSPHGTRRHKREEQTRDHSNDWWVSSISALLLRNLSTHAYPPVGWVAMHVGRNARPCITPSRYSCR